MPESLSRKYFNDVYDASEDPWSFETSAYESAKYSDTIKALTRDCYGNALELGCSIGVLTERLAARCDSLLGTDVSEKALAKARKRCAIYPHVRFECLRAPEEFPDGEFDLIVVSEVAYYWSREDLERAASKIRSHMTAGGELLLVHFTPVVHDYPLTGDQVHEFFLERDDFERVHGHAAERYRLDLLRAR